MTCSFMDRSLRWRELMRRSRCRANQTKPNQILCFSQLWIISLTITISRKKLTIILVCLCCSGSFFMAVVMLQQWLLILIFVQCLIYSCVVHCSVSQTDSADCEFPQFSAPPFPPTPSLSNYPLDPWTPGQVVPPWLVPNSPWMPRQLVPPTSTPAQFGTPLLPQTPRQLLPPPSASSQTTASSLPAKQLSRPPFIPEPSNSHLLPKIPRQLIPPPPPPPLARAQSNAPFLPRRPADIISPPLSTGESSTGSFPQTPQQQQSGSSSAFKQLQFGQQPFLLQGKSLSSSNRAKAIGTAVGVTLAITIIVAGVSICLILKCCKRRRREARNSGVAIGTPPRARAGGGKNLKGLIVDEKGRDMVYWRKDEQGNDKARNSFSTEAYDLYKERVRKENDNIPLIRGKSLTVPQPLAPISEVNPRLESQSAGVRFESGDKKSPVNALALAAPEARLPPLWPSVRKGLGKHTDRKENLKPLQREQVSINVDHPTTWGEHNGASLSYDGDLMEAMFGSVAIKRRTSKSAEDKSPATPTNAKLSSAQIILLDSRRSQNIASILQTVRVSRQELLDALNDGKGLNADILEKLSRITPTKREESLILAFSGHPPSLAHAESFLYHMMKSVPLAFPRISAMLFRLNYQTEIQYLDEHVRTLEKGCYELRESVLLFKLIEAALRAGNEMNAGASSRATHSFNITSLWKLFDIQIPDGKNTIIQSVVEGVAISEGKQCVINRDNRLNLSGRNTDSSSSLSKQNSRKFMILGLPLVSGLSAEFPNAKKAAAVDYYTYFLIASSTLAAGLNGIQDTVRQCNSRYGDGGFVTEMRTFLDKATQDLSEKTEEQMRVIRLVKTTTDYYQSGAPTKEDASPFQLFPIVKEFLDMVDQACKHLSESLHRRKTNEANTGSVFVNPPPV